MDFYSGTNSDELRKSPKGFVAVILAVGLIIGVTAGAAKIISDFEPVTMSNSTADSSVAELIPDSSLPEQNAVYATESIDNAQMNRGPLILVNDENAYVEFTDDLVKMYDVKSDSYYISSGEMLLRKSGADALNAMMDAFVQATGKQNVQLISGYRTQEYQQTLYDNDLKKTGKDYSEFVAKPGHSEHQTGLACDFNLFFGDYSEDFDGTGDYAWLGQHCTEFGFILRYPEQKATVTKIGFEPWHFRYVGAVHAAEMTRRNLCLEEYIDLLGSYTYEGEHLILIDGNKKKYEAYTVPVDAMNSATVLPVPSDLQYTVSGNNVNGFVVTVDLNETATDDEIALQTTESVSTTAVDSAAGTGTTDTTTADTTTTSVAE